MSTSSAGRPFILRLLRKGISVLRSYHFHCIFQLVVDNAYNSDPRIQRFKQEDKDKKAAMKKAKQEAARAKQEEEERRRREAEQKAKQEKEEQERIAKEKVGMCDWTISLYK